MRSHIIAPWVESTKNTFERSIIYLRSLKNTKRIERSMVYLRYLKKKLGSENNSRFAWVKGQLALWA